MHRRNMDIWRSCRGGGGRGRGLRRGRFGRVRSHGRKRLWKMACGRAPTKGGRIAHLTTKRFRPFEAIQKSELIVLMKMQESEVMRRKKPGGRKGG